MIRQISTVNFQFHFKMEKSDIIVVKSEKNSD